MNFFQQPLFYALLMCIAGIGIPIMAALNSYLGNKLSSPVFATTILFMVASSMSLVALFFSGGIPKPHIKEPIPIVFYLGGIFVVFYILSMTWVAPKFGIGNAISMVLLGQLFSMVVIDHFGLLGAIKHTVSIQRLSGLALMILGVYLTIRRF